MFIKVLHTFFLYVIVYVCAFDDIYVNGEVSNEMIEQGRLQYQLLKERGTLPQYGNCWKSAVQHVEDGCKYLSEETQSDIALHLTNCFLVMSGHDPYSCVDDKKPNLRAICINSMTDRAFNVYTEFYTHTQNICWFLRGQIWHETISENTYKVGRQLETSAQNQESILESQRQSMELQEKILKNGKLLGQVLEDLYISTRAHQELLSVLTKSLAGFQAWVIGEISWFDSIIFYTISGFCTLIFSSTQRTAHTRLPIILLLFLNLIIERFICYLLISEDSLININLLYEDIYSYIWFYRYLFVFCIIIYILYAAYYYQDINVKNQNILQNISKQNDKMLRILENIDKSGTSDYFELITENSINTKDNSFSFKDNSFSSHYKENSFNSSPVNGIILNDYLNNNPKLDVKGYKTTRYSPRPALSKEINGGRYYLRSSRQNTPDIN